MKAPKLTTEEKKEIISQIMSTLKNQAFLLGRQFDAGIFFSLIFMADKELLNTKKLCGL